MSIGEKAKKIAAKTRQCMDVIVDVRSPDVNTLATRQQAEFCYKQDMSQTTPLPFPKGEDEGEGLSSLGSLSELDLCYGPEGTLGKTGRASIIPPRPVCGERIEVRGIRKPLFGIRVER